MAEIPLCEPALGDEEVADVEEVIRSGWLTHGPKNEEFEAAFADVVGVDHAVSMNSCTSALQLALECNDVTGEVLVPSFTFVASANAIVTAGATPVFVDVDRDTRNVDPDALAAAVTEDTEAVMVVHYGGQPCDMGPIQDLVEAHDLLLIEDSAETIGGTWQGGRAGSFGIGCFSFYPTKNITTGEGGMLTTDDEELADRVRAAVGHGIPSTTLNREGADRSWYRAATSAGYNYRMSNLQAALGCRQLSRLEELNELRRSHATALTEKLAGVDGVEPPVERGDRRHVYQMYTVLTDPDLPRDDLVEALNERGIGASVHFYPPVHQQPRYEDSPGYRSPLPETEFVAENIVSLPMYPGLTDAQLDRIGAAVEAAISEVN